MSYRVSLDEMERRDDRDPPVPRDNLAYLDLRDPREFKERV